MGGDISVILTTYVDLLAGAKSVLYTHWYVLAHTTVIYALTLTSFLTTVCSDEVGPPLNPVHVAVALRLFALVELSLRLSSFTQQIVEVPRSIS